MIIFFPLNFFYFFVYYTDTLSSLSIVLLLSFTHTFLLQRTSTTSTSPQVIAQSVPYLRHLVLFLLSSFAILCRQTNAIWVMFCVGIVMLATLVSCGLYRPSPSLTLATVWSFCGALLSNLPALLSLCSSLLLPVIGFTIFVFGFNEGSIVVGQSPCLSLSFCLSVSLSLCLSLCLSVSFSLSLSLSLSLSIYLSPSLCVCLSLSLSPLTTVHSS
jgi:hypothetical protein